MPIHIVSAVVVMGFSAVVASTTPRHQNRQEVRPDLAANIRNGDHDDPSKPFLTHVMQSKVEHEKISARLHREDISTDAKNCWMAVLNVTRLEKMLHDRYIDEILNTMRRHGVKFRRCQQLLARRKGEDSYGWVRRKLSKLRAILKSVVLYSHEKNPPPRLAVHEALRRLNASRHIFDTILQAIPGAYFLRDLSEYTRTSLRIFLKPRVMNMWERSMKVLKMFLMVKGVKALIGEYGKLAVGILTTGLKLLVMAA